MAIEDSTSEPPAELELSAALTAETRRPSEVRELTVSYQRSTMLRLQGCWLDRAGLPIGTKVRVYVYPRRLEIEAIGEAPIAEVQKRKRTRPSDYTEVDRQPPRLDD